MRAAMKENSLPAPEFRQEELGNSQVKVTLRNDIVHRKVFIDADAMKIIGKTIFENLNEHERRIINFIAERNRINVSEVQLLNKCTWPAAKKTLMGLVNKGILLHVRKRGVTRDPQAYFVLKPPNNVNSDAGNQN